jgi:hypothetical protein
LEIERRKKLEKLDPELIQEQMKLLARLSEKYHLTEHRGQICLEWMGSKIYFLNFAIKELYLKFVNIYFLIRLPIEAMLNKMFSQGTTFEEAKSIDKNLAPMLTKLFYLGFDHDKTDFDILLRKMNSQPHNEDHAIFLLDLVQAFDYAVFRGQQLIRMLDEVLESGDLNKAKELDEKDILPYKLIAVKEGEEINEKIIDEMKGVIQEKPPEETEKYDLRRMRVIGEA